MPRINRSGSAATYRADGDSNAAPQNDPQRRPVPERVIRSQSGHYLVPLAKREDTGGAPHAYARLDLPVPPLSMERSKSGGVYIHEGRDYGKYIPRPVIKDCLESTEQMMLGLRVPPPENSVNSQLHGSLHGALKRAMDTSIGESDKQNKRLARTIDQSTEFKGQINENATAQPGQGLITLLKGKPAAGHSPYHAGFVAAKDEKHLMVLETSAGATDAKRVAKTKPEVNLCEIGSPTSFHSINQPDYKNSVTVPIQLKDPQE